LVLRRFAVVSGLCAWRREVTDNAPDSGSAMRTRGLCHARKRLREQARQGWRWGAARPARTALGACGFVLTGVLGVLFRGSRDQDRRAARAAAVPCQSACAGPHSSTHSREGVRIGEWNGEWRGECPFPALREWNREFPFAVPFPAHSPFGRVREWVGPFPVRVGQGMGIPRSQRLQVGIPRSGQSGNARHRLVTWASEV